jgi:hypothetical protein
VPASHGRDHLPQDNGSLSSAHSEREHQEVTRDGDRHSTLFHSQVHERSKNSMLS